MLPGAQSRRCSRSTKKTSQKYVNKPEYHMKFLKSIIWKPFVKNYMDLKVFMNSFTPTNNTKNGRKYS